MAQNRWLWIGGITAAVLAVGGVAYAASGPSAPALNPGPSPPPSPTPGPAPSPPPSPQTLPAVPATPLLPTDPIPATAELLGSMQAMLAALVAGGFVPNAPQPPYSRSDVDNDPNNPKFVATLAALQQSVSTGANTINTQGVADWASWALILILYAMDFRHAATGQVTDPALITLAQQALLTQNKFQLPSSFPADGTINPGFVTAVKAFQALMAGSNLPALTTDGTLDYTTLAGLLLQAYVQH